MPIQACCSSSNSRKANRPTNHLLLSLNRNKVLILNNSNSQHSLSLYITLVLKQ